MHRTLHFRQPLIHPETLWSGRRSINRRRRYASDRAHKPANDFSSRCLAGRQTTCDILARLYIVVDPKVIVGLLLEIVDEHFVQFRRIGIPLSGVPIHRDAVER